jgi:hypothetical protein
MSDNCFRFPAPLAKNQRRALAYRQAAGAAMAFALGDVPMSCALHDRVGRTTCRGINTSVPDRVLMAMAGMAMDRHLGSKIERDDKDYRRVWKIALDAFPDSTDDAIKLVNGCESRIDRLMQRCARGAMALGAELCKRGRLDRWQMDAILSKTVPRLKFPAMDEYSPQLSKPFKPFKDPPRLASEKLAASQDQESRMPLPHPKMQQMEDPNKISAATNQPRGPNQHLQFSHDLSSNTPQQDPQMNGRGQALGMPGPAGREPGTRAPSTQLASNGNGNGSKLIENLCQLLDMLDEEEDDGGEYLADQSAVYGGSGAAPASQGAPSGGTTMNQAPSLKPSPMRRELSPAPVKLPAAHDSMSYSVGDARIVDDQHRSFAQAFDQHLRRSGMRSEASRKYALDMALKIRARNNAMATDSATGTLDGFAQFRPGAMKIDVLNPSTTRPPTVNKKRPAQDSAAHVWVTEFNPITNMMEQRAISRDVFNKLKHGT